MLRYEIAINSEILLHPCDSLAAGGFAIKRVPPKRVRTRHIDSTSDQVLNIYLSLAEQERLHCGPNETKSANMFISRTLIHRRWKRTRNRILIMSSGVRTRLGAKLVAFDSTRKHKSCLVRVYVKNLLCVKNILFSLTITKTSVAQSVYPYLHSPVHPTLFHRVLGFK